MDTKRRYQEAENRYALCGVDTEKAMEAAARIPLSMHCWQGDDVRGFDSKGPLTGGIQTTGSYPYAARTPEELMMDIDKALSLIPGTKKLNLHASYAIFPKGVWADRDELAPEHFAPWADFAKKRGLGIDFNPTFFSHPKADPMKGTLSSAEEDIRAFWIRHAKACLKISEYFARQTGQPCLMNIWIPDGSKDLPGTRINARKRLLDSLDQILSEPYDKNLVKVSVESKVFGIGVESMTVGSHEFYMNYAATRKILCLIDTGHFHPTENAADKLSSMLLFSDYLALHVSRPVRWDSDHVTLFDDHLRELAAEIVRCGAEKFYIGMDFFDASINRIGAWANGMRAMEKALLYAELLPNERMAQLQDEGRFSELMSLREEMKVLPFGDVWEEYLRRQEVPSEEAWFSDCMKYEKEVLSGRA